MTRKKGTPPQQLADRVMFDADGICCVCRNPGRPVQIHHIDGNPSNNAIENLAVLCFDCHHKTQIQGGFDRKLGPGQVTLYRDDWHRLVAQRRASGQHVGDLGEPAAGQPLDTDVVEKILAEEFPSENVLAGDDYGSLLDELRYLEVDEAHSFRTITRKHRDWVLCQDREKVERVKEWDRQGRGSGVSYPDTAVARARDLGVFYSHVGLAKQALMREFKYGVRILVDGKPI